MQRWKLLRPRNWRPGSMERILWRAPDGSEIRTGTMIAAEVDDRHHRIGVGKRIFNADRRDVFQHWDRIEDQRQCELEAAEEAAEPQADHL